MGNRFVTSCNGLQQVSYRLERLVAGGRQFWNEFGPSHTQFATGPDWRGGFVTVRMGLSRGRRSPADTCCGTHVRWRDARASGRTLCHAGLSGLAHPQRLQDRPRPRECTPCLRTRGAIPGPCHFNTGLADDTSSPPPPPPEGLHLKGGSSLPAPHPVASVRPRWPSHHFAPARRCLPTAVLTASNRLCNRS